MAVLVSGASGFIALHVINLLLKDGYKVIGTVRSQAKADKLVRQFKNDKLTIEIAPDISDISAFDEVVKKYASEIDSVIHMASPLPEAGITDYENHYLIPAVNGTKSMLNSIKKYAPHNVKRVVITSSVAAMMDVSDPTSISTEKTWNPITWEQAQTGVFPAYLGSKTFAEKAAWEFYKENEGVVDFKMATVNPVMVFGPQLFDEDVSSNLNASNSYLSPVVHYGPNDKPSTEYSGSSVDVIDVAKAHVAAMKNDELIGKRLLLSHDGYSEQSIINSLNRVLPQLKGKIPPPVEGHDFVQAKSDATVTTKLLGYKFKTFDETIHDFALQLFKKEGVL